MTVRQRLALVGAAILVIGCAGVAISSNDLVWTSKPHKSASGPQRIINFGGFFWKVRTSDGGAELPSSGAWSDSSDNVWIDSNGALHLKVTVVNGHRVSAEVDSLTPFSYGTYRWKLKLDPNKLDLYTVLGLYTYGPSTRENTPNEIDIEHGKFFSERRDGTASQFVVQPYKPSGHLFRFKVPAASIERIEQVTWTPRSIDFKVLDAANPSGTPIAQWTFDKAAEVPVFRLDTLHMNFWSYDRGKPRTPPVNEAVIESFSFTPTVPTTLPAQSTK